ncbi:REP-associated tyrosine transposase [Stutzerimonas nitrititolerans]|uniref:REP-associated tyrosine transposase n=1 Tax=Stutzerimonas nitrititolerans TaxID=2482751 RepID=UPI0028A9B93B|nr:transposase [Stutzerimonas nitrititolerans]
MRFHGRELRKGRNSVPNQAYLLTSVTLNREPVFEQWLTASTLAREIHHAGQTGRVESLAWVIMPDHLHWLVVLKEGPLSQLMQQFKSRSAIALNRVADTHGPLWQKGYHDRSIRHDEDLRAAARYVIANPLRAGLVRHIGLYPFWDAVWLQHH